MEEALTTAAPLFLLNFLKHSEKNPNFVVMMEDTFQDHFQIKEGQKYFCQPNESLKEFFFFISSLSQSFYLKTLCFIVLAGPIKKITAEKYSNREDSQNAFEVYEILVESYLNVCVDKLSLR